MTISIIRELQIRHMNVVIAFLYELLDEDVYVIQFHMFEFEKDEEDTFVCKLKKALYDLKQTSKMWYNIIHKFLIDLNFKRSNSNHAVFIKNDIFLIMYVNDLLLFDSNLNDLQNIQNQLKQRFKMTNLKQLSHYLEMKITITFDKLIFTQSIYLKKMLNQFEMKNSRSVSIFRKSEMINSLMSATDEADQATIK
jgi:transcriptional regulator of heat shock response